MDRIYFITWVTSILLAGTAFAEPAPKKPVRILSWWGYIKASEPKVIAIENKCQTRISVDEFYSNTEFLARLGESSTPKNPFDILVFSDTVYTSKQLGFLSKSKLHFDRGLSGYSEPVKDFFKSRRYDAATGIFQISLSGFLVNKNLMRISPNDPLSLFFTRAQDNIVVLLDDHVEITTLLSNWECSEHKNECSKLGRSLFPSEEKLKQLVGKAKLVISSDLADITKHPNFALAYTWSGDALRQLDGRSNLEFLLHPSLSHTSMDLLSLVGTSKEAKCVAEAMASKEFLDTVARRTRYFSPYGPVDAQDPSFHKIQREFFDRFSKLGRIRRMTQDESLEIDKKWQLFKILFGKKI